MWTPGFIVRNPGWRKLNFCKQTASAGQKLHNYNKFCPCVNEISWLGKFLVKVKVKGGKNMIFQPLRKYFLSSQMVGWGHRGQGECQGRLSGTGI